MAAASGLRLLQEGAWIHGERRGRRSLYGMAWTVEEGLKGGAVSGASSGYDLGGGVSLVVLRRRNCVVGHIVIYLWKALRGIAPLLM